MPVFPIVPAMLIIEIRCVNNIILDLTVNFGTYASQVAQVNCARVHEFGDSEYTESPSIR